jgi:predicted DNA-binding protein
VAKDEVYNLRWSAELRDRVQTYAREQGYDDMATLIREAIQEKIDPKMREGYPVNREVSMQDG